MKQTYLPIRVQRIWGQAVRAYLSSSTRPEIRSLNDMDRTCMQRALNAFVQTPKGADQQTLTSVEASRARIKANEMSGEEPLTSGLFDKAATFVEDVSAVYEALYAWVLAISEYLEKQVSSLSEEELVGLKRVLPTFLQPSDQTPDLDVESIRDALMEELRQDATFDIDYWTGAAMGHLEGVMEIYTDASLSAAITIPPRDPLPPDEPQIVTVDKKPTSRSAEPVHSLKENALTGLNNDCYDIDVDD